MFQKIFIGSQKHRHVLFMLVGLVASVLLIVQSVRQQQNIATRAAAGQGVPYIDPAGIPLTNGQQIPATIAVDAGPNEQVVLAFLTFVYDPSQISIANCAGASGFIGMVPLDACVIDSVAGRIEVQVEASADVGPSGNVILAQLNITSRSNGPLQIVLLGYELVMEDAAGNPIDHSGGLIGESDPGTGGITATPTVQPGATNVPGVPTSTPVPGVPTATPIPGAPTATLVPGIPTATPVAPTPTLTPTNTPIPTQTPMPTPTPPLTYQTYSPTSGMPVLIILIGVVAIFFTMMH